MKLHELSNEELDRIAITEVCGYKDGLKIGANYPTYWYPPDCTDPIHKSKVHPTTCRNQSKLVRDAAYAKTDAPLDPSFDPRLEVIASIEAVRAFTSVGTQGESVEITGGKG